MTLQFSDQRSIYMQIADFICENILSGAMKPDERVPSVRDMATQIEVNPNTVQRSYTWLQERGILQNRRGIGYFIEQDAYVKVKQMKREHFVSEELPELFRKMSLIGYDMEDLQSFFSRQKDQI
ncbi:MAG: GntR family transcriptional regulator [Saprospiraceae bacterium]|nr:GntR family transcriptional regulator [Saprospiraceae bacterium]